MEIFAAPLAAPKVLWIKLIGSIDLADIKTPKPLSLDRGTRHLKFSRNSQIIEGMVITKIFDRLLQ